MRSTGLKMLCLALALALTVGLTGCGTNENPSGSDVSAVSDVSGGPGAENQGFYDADGNYYTYFDENNDYVWDGFTDALGNRFYFFDEDGDGTPDGYSDEEGSRFYYNGGSGENSGAAIQPSPTNTTVQAPQGSAGGKVTTTTAFKAPDNSGGTVATAPKPTLSSKELYAQIKGSRVKIMYAGEVSAIEKKVITAFERAYSCKVDTTVVAWNDFKNQFLTMVTSGNVPDTCGIPDETFLKWVSKGLLQPLDSYINMQDGGWSKAVWDAYSWKGQHYGVNGDGGVTPLFCIYNASLFKAKGVKTPMEYYKEGTWNFNNFKKTCIAMTYGNVTGASVSWRYLLHLCNGNTVVSVDSKNGKVTNNLADKTAVTATELLVELRRGNYVSFESPFEPFGNGEMAMVLERPWNIIGQFDLYNTTMKNAEIEIAPLPKGPDAKQDYCVSILNGKGVPTKAKNPLGACAWYYFNEEYRKAHLNDADVVENRRKTYTDAQYKFVQEYTKNRSVINTFVYGVGNWYSDDWGYWASMINDGLTVQAANSKFAGEFQSMIDTLGNS